MRRTSANPVVHLELHTDNLARACEFYGRLFGWRTEVVDSDGCPPYRALDMGGVGGGVVECETGRSLWLPYVEVGEITRAMESPDREFYARWPEKRLDSGARGSIFESFGLPDRLTD